MSLILVADSEIPSLVKRSNAYGYDSVHFLTNKSGYVNVRGEGTSIVVEPAEPSEDNSQGYLLYCKEFGTVSGYEADFRVLFCDAGYMLITLKTGVLALSTDDGIILISSEPVEASNNNITWYNINTFLGYMPRFGTKGMFSHDIEWSFSSNGKNLVSNSGLDRDISLGYLALYEQKHRKAGE